MLKPRSRAGKYWFPLHSHPISRVLKFEAFVRYLREIPAADCVLDYGSGDRPYEELLLTKFRRYIAADHPTTNLAHARKPDINILDDRIPLADHSVDCVILTEVLEHIYRPWHALREMHRLLKEGGHLIGSVPFSIGQHEVPYDYYRYTYYSLDRLFRETGFEILHLDYIGDAVGVTLSNISTIFSLLPKALRKARMNWLAVPAVAVFKIPEYVYYHSRRLGLDPQRWEVFKRFPLGFSFLLAKRSVQSSHRRIVADAEQ